MRGKPQGSLRHRSVSFVALVSAVLTLSAGTAWASTVSAGDAASALTPAPTSAAAAGVAPLPASAFIQGVPLYQQIEAHGCGAAALQMVLDYWGPFVDQRTVYDAARTWKGSSLPDLTRAGQFSPLSYTQGDQFPPFASWGYPGRPLGYAAFYYASDNGQDWLTGLKALIAQGYPVIVLTDWFPGVYGPHYRVITGYDDAKGLIYLNDPWARELKHLFDYQGSAQQAAASGDAIGSYSGYAWTQADFLAVWKLSTQDWGIPGKAYGAVLVTPWKVEVSAPATVAPGTAFTVSVTATYPCPAPFGTDGFPAFPAANSGITLALPAGLTAVGATSVDLGTVAAGATVHAEFTVRAGSQAGAFDLAATASGLIKGSLGPWRSYPAYEYGDVIGGTGSTTVTVAAP